MRRIGQELEEGAEEKRKGQRRRAVNGTWASAWECVLGTSHLPMESKILSERVKMKLFKGSLYTFFGSKKTTIHYVVYYF